MDAEQPKTTTNEDQRVPHDDDYYKQKWKEENAIRQLLLMDYNIC